MLETAVQKEILKSPQKRSRMFGIFKSKYNLINSGLDDILLAVTRLLQEMESNEEVEQDEIIVVLKHIQRLDPIGVGSRNLAECLNIQLETVDTKAQYLVEAKKLLQYYELLISNDLNKLSETYFKLKESTEKNHKKIEAIKSFNSYLNSFLLGKQEMEAWVLSENPSDADICNDFNLVSNYITSIIAKFDSIMNDVSNDLAALQNKMQDVTKQGQVLRSDIDKIQEGAGELARKRQALQQSIINLENDIHEHNHDYSVIGMEYHCQLY
jgi:peptidoglycan hydrolase CwlO-like protein